ncbi:MAG: GNAT family N-acetyltransferase [Pseudomonadota bacterium]|nr:GNAT family N-acetyltransferase [Pseudomonadota bacterium]
MEIALVTADAEIRRCFPVMVQLRTALSEEEFVRRIRQQHPDGYRLACLEDGGNIMSVAGFRIGGTLSHGKRMYVDDLVTDVRHQARGYGGQLFGWLIRHATAEGCAELHLDSGVQRFDAHRFYLKHGMHIIAHHFSLGLDRQP